jgi:twitching motility protein PilI
MRMAKHAPAPTARKRASSFETLADYEARSLTHAPGRPELVEAPGHWRGVGFRLGQRRLVSSFEEVVEILSLPSVTPVPGAQPWMLGVANVRGTLLPVVDLKQFLEGERTLVHEGQRVLVVRQSGGNVAVIIDELFGQRTFNDTHRAQMDGENEGRYGQLVNQVYRLNDVSWGVFSMQTLTRTPEFRQATL